MTMLLALSMPLTSALSMTSMGMNSLRKARKLSHSYPTWETLSYLQTLTTTAAAPQSSSTSSIPQNLITTSSGSVGNCNGSGTSRLSPPSPHKELTQGWHHQSYITSPLQPTSTSTPLYLSSPKHHNSRHHHTISTATLHTLSQPWKHLFSFTLPEGHCVGLELTATATAPQLISSNSFEKLMELASPHLDREEVQYVSSLKGIPAGVTFVLGRLAIRASLEEMTVAGCRGEDGEWQCHSDNDSNGSSNGSGEETMMAMQRRALIPPILRDKHGRPILPSGFLGSISHKGLIGVALVDFDDYNYTKSVGRSKGQRSIGVDVEQSYTRRQNVGKRVLTQRERDDLGKIKGVTRDEEVLLRFSLKESLYKAMHPLLTQYVGFQEAEISPHEDGTATVHLMLKNGAHERFADVTAHWRRIQGDYFLTSASVTLKEEHEHND